MKTFGFNLTPTKSEETIKKEAKRDRSDVLTAVLPLVGVLFWLGVILFNGLVIERNKSKWEESIAQKEKTIEVDFLATRVLHGELVSKTNSLAEVIGKDINPDILFFILDKIFKLPADEQVRVVGYGREKNGYFTVTFATQSSLKLAEVVRRFTNYEGTKDVSITNVTRDEETGEQQGQVMFYFDTKVIDYDSK